MGDKKLTDQETKIVVNIKSFILKGRKIALDKSQIMALEFIARKDKPVIWWTLMAFVNHKSLKLKQANGKWARLIMLT